MMEYSQEELNYFRLCYLEFNLVPVGLRQIFKNEWDFLYKTSPPGEWKDTPKNGLDFFNNESKASHRKNRRCLATIQNGNTGEWDCTCLFFAILYSDSIGTTLGPAIRICVDDLRQVRNDIAHISEAELTDADFQAYVGRVLNAFSSLGLPINGIEDIKNQTSFPTEEVENLRKEVRDLQNELAQTKNTLKKTEDDLISAKEENKALTQEISSKLEPFCILTLQPPHEVIRRSNDIERIKTEMQQLCNGANGAVSTVYLSGNPGCGKSQLARQIGHEIFSQRTKNTEDFIFVATLNAESMETLADSYITLGRHLGITEYALTSLESSKTKKEKPGETIQQLQRLISPKVKTFFKWIIIADNVIDLGLVRGFLPQTGSEEWGHGQVLFATQDSTTIPHNAPHTYHESFSGGMQPDEAVELLEKVSQISDREQAGKIAKVLDYQPLALAAAAYYVQTVVTSGSPNFSWREYLGTLTQNQREATENLLASENSAYPKTTMTAVKMAFQRAVETDQVLYRTFSFFALCAHEVLSLEAVIKFVTAFVTDQPKELIKAKIVRSSLILVATEEGAERIYLRLHSIVHSVVKQGAICNLESRKNDQNIAEAVKIFNSLLELNKDNYALLKTLMPHCKSLLEYATSHFTLPLKLTPFIDLDEVICYLGSFAEVCRKLSDLSFAKDVVDLACSLVRNIHDTDAGALATAWIFNTSGVVYQDIAKLDQAQKFHEKALRIQKKILGEEHIDTATGFKNLASVHYEFGEYNQAKELNEKALMIEKKILGEENSAIAQSYSNLATVHCKIGEYNQAKELHEKALMIQEKILGEEHIDTALSYNNLASVHCKIGEYNQAKELHEKALMIQEKILGEEHIETAKSYNNLALVHCNIGEYNQAKELDEKAVMIVKKILGEEHTYTATSCHNLALVHYNIGEYNQANELFEKALMIQKKILGEEHIDIATICNNLASVHYNIGEYNQAKELFEKALMIVKKILGEEHTDTATIYGNLASVYESIGEHSQAKELYQKARIFSETMSDFVITKPDKGSGVVLMDKSEYLPLSSEAASINDSSKFYAVSLERPKTKGRPPKYYNHRLHKKKKKKN